MPSTRLLAHYDLLNQIVTAVQFHTRHVAETVVAQRSIAEIPERKEQIITEKLSYKPRTILNSLGIPVNAQTTITYRLIRASA